MKKKRITYGVSGMMEYQCIIRFGKNTLKVTFTGGSMNAIGVTPATFATSNFLIQQAIENSSEFRRGRIHIVKEIDLNEELRIERAVTNPVALSGKGSDKPVPAKLESDGEDFAQAEGNTAESVSSEHASVVTEPLSKNEENVTAMTQVEFSCNDDAKDYLEQTFGCIRSKLHNREDIINAGKAHDVEIVFV